jgi:hypothetical protein
VVDFSKQLPGRVSDYAEFKRHFLGGAKVKRTDRFHLHTPIDPHEVLISGLLETADDIAGLRDLVAGRASDDRITQVVFGFYVKSLVELDGPVSVEV